jgi:uncharacterized membrane protein YeaQ/YmgE (transglycosylase-associated protein family)
VVLQSRVHRCASSAAGAKMSLHSVPFLFEVTKVIGALILGLVAGFIGRALVPNDVFQDMSGPKSWGLSIVLGLAGAFVGYVIFTLGLGIGDDDAFDLGGILSAIIGVVIVLLVAGFVLRRAGRGPQTAG